MTNNVRNLKANCFISLTSDQPQDSCKSKTGCSTPI